MTEQQEIDEDHPQQWSDKKLVTEIRKMLDSYGDEYNDPLIEALARLIERSRIQNADATGLSKKEKEYVQRTIHNIKINIDQGDHQIAINGVEAIEQKLKKKGILDK